MVYSASLSIVPPEGAGTFENLIASLVEEEFDVKTHRHGRSGQSDDGVDIYYRKDDGSWIGIQCKNTEELDFNTVEEETERAEEFEPEISEFIIVTSAPQDANIQNQIRIYSDERVEENCFPVSVWMWNDLCRLLSKNDDVLQDFYSDLFYEKEASISAVDKYDLITLSEEYFETKNPRSAIDAWKTNFTLSEINEGYAFSRFQNGAPIEQEIAYQARERQDTIILGSPGSGKSTILKQVAIHWHKHNIGEVIYRSATNTTPLKCENDLIEELKSIDDHVLFVIEDALREDVDSLELVQRLSDSQNITFLLEARLREWEEFDNVKISNETPRAAPHSLHTIKVPEITKEDVGNAVDQYERRTGQDVSVNEGYIFNKLSSDTEIGGMMILSHYISQFGSDIDFLGQESNYSLLYKSIRSKVEEIENLGDLELKLSVLITALQASGIPPHPELLHSIDAGHREIDNSIQDLQGVILHGDAGDYYRTYHSHWCSRYLYVIIQTVGRERSIEIFEDSINSLFRVFDDEQKRSSINKWFRQNKFPDDIEEGHHSDIFVDRIFSIGRRDIDLATLFVPTKYSDLKIPENTTLYTALQTRIWRGTIRLRRAGSERGESDLDLARDEFRDLIKFIDSLEIDEDSTDSIKSLCYGNLATLHRIKGEFEKSRSYLEESLLIERRMEDYIGLSITLSSIANVAQQQGDLEEAETKYKESIKISRQIEDHHGWAKSIASLSSVYLNRGDIDTAENLNNIALRKF